MKNKILKNSIFAFLLAITIVLGTFIAFPLSIPIVNYSNNQIGQISVPILEFIVSIVFVLLVKKIFKSFFFGFTKIKTNLTLPITIPVVITVLLNLFTSSSLNLLSNKMTIIEILIAVFWSLIGAICVGFYEEITLRSGLFNLLMNIFNTNKLCILISSILSSLIFGLLHLLNLSGGAPILATLGQVIYATAMGFFLAVTYLKMQSILVPITIHAVIDWSDFLFNFSGEPNFSIFMTMTISIGLAAIYIVCGVIVYNDITIKNNYLGFKKN